VNDKLNEMWAALEAHKPAPSYAEAWQTMLRERTEEAARAAALAAADAGAWGVTQAAWAAGWAAAAEAAEAAARVGEYAQRAINAIRRVTP
jgi:hypothetical protein